MECSATACTSGRPAADKKFDKWYGLVLASKFNWPLDIDGCETGIDKWRFGWFWKNACWDVDGIPKNRKII